ncbi:MAG: calcium/sodium antiporter [Clostridia bacterium]|nr:calcium/sodium antiporter [Clostridia bacterium]
MNEFIVILLFMLGLVLIIKGGDYFVDSAVWFAEALNVPKFIIGATIVSFATTLPELLVSLFASIEGKNVMAAGNAIGSVTANLGLIMGISIVCIPAIVKRGEFAFKGILMAASCGLLWLFASGGNISVAESIIMLIIFAVFMTENALSAKKNISSSEKEEINKKDLGKNIFFFIIGILGIVIGSDLLVDNGSEIARMFGISEGIISVTIIAVGTSLPELVTTITAISKKQSSLSVGNIIGANIIDLCVILPLCSLVSGGKAAVEAQTYAIDIPVCLGIILLAIIPPILFKRLYRFQGIFMLLAYVAYITYVCISL